MLGLRGALYPGEELGGPANPGEDLPTGVAANGGAECTCADPFLETC